ncbi:MAG: cytochrome c [Rhodospirillales bacterium]|nr:cytochrome c [Rhodospirillales bacterium]
MIRAILFAGSIGLTAPGAIADEVNVESGRRFAELNCARCHAIGPAGLSPLDPALPFRTFAKKWPLESLEESLAEGIVTGHSDMPEFELTPRQIGNFIGYLETIQQK